MSKTAVITARLDAETMASLDALARRLDRTRSWIVAQAVTQAVQAEAEIEEFLREGQDALRNGHSVSQDGMESWMEARIHARAVSQTSE